MSYLGSQGKVKPIRTEGRSRSWDGRISTLIRRGVLVPGLVAALACGDPPARTELGIPVGPDSAESATEDGGTASLSGSGPLPVAPEPSESTGPAPEAPRPSGLPRLSLVSEFGCEACTGPELLDLIRIVAAGPGRSLAVIDRSEPLVRVWDMDAGSSTAFGAVGGAPGELGYPVGVVLRSDSVLVFEGGGAETRIEVFTRDGAYLGPLPIPEPRMAGRSDDFRASASANWLIWTTRLPDFTTRVLRVAEAGSGPAREVAVPLQQLTGSSDPLLMLRVAAAVSDAGVVALGYGEEYRLALYSPDGALLATAGREIPRRIRPQEEIDAYLEARSREIEALGLRRVPELNVTRFRDVPHFGRGGLRFDASGRLWVMTLQDRYNTIFDVFGQNLEYLGAVEVEGSIGDYHISRSLLVASSWLPSGIASVRVWNLLEP